MTNAGLVESSTASSATATKNISAHHPASWPWATSATPHLRCTLPATPTNSPLNGVTIYTNDSKPLSDSLTSALGPNPKIKVDSRTISRLEKGPHRAQVILHFSDGSQAVEGFLGHKPKCQLNGTCAQQLGLELTPQGDLKATPPFYQTSLSGVFTAGDASSPVKIAPNALFTGAAAAAGVAAQLQAEALGHKSMV